MSAGADRTDQRWYGRRTGRKLRVHRQRLMDELLPRLRVDPKVELDDLAALFDEPVDDVWMEIGFGAGEHLAGQAARYPEIGFIGCEPYVNGMAALLSEVAAGGLDNVRLYDDDVRQLIPALPDASIGKLFILFSDPWPKARHHRRRITVEENIDAFARIMKPGAEFRFATDQAEFAEWTLERMLRDKRFVWQAARAADWRTAPEDWIETRYQQKAKGRGLASVYLIFRRA